MANGYFLTPWVAETSLWALLSMRVLLGVAEGVAFPSMNNMVSRLDLSQDSNLMLSANHLQKLWLSFLLTTPLGNTFKPHQVLLKLRHETKLEHIFILENSARLFKIVLDFLSLVEKFYYLSGKYDIELTVGDITMENSFLLALGNVELDLPEAPEKATRPPLQHALGNIEFARGTREDNMPPLQPVDPYLRFRPKQEMSHIFRASEKRPPKELSYTFLGFTLLPLVGFLFGVSFVFLVHQCTSETCMLGPCQV